MEYYYILEKIESKTNQEEATMIANYAVAIAIMNTDTTLRTLGKTNVLVPENEAIVDAVEKARNVTYFDKEEVCKILGFIFEAKRSLFNISPDINADDTVSAFVGCTKPMQKFRELVDRDKEFFVSIYKELYKAL